MDSDNVERCVRFLKGAKTDNDRFAALLMVTKLVNPSKCDSKERRKLFEAIGFKFVIRLLKTGKFPEDCPKNVLKSIAVVLISCFCTDEELVSHPDMLATVSFLREIVEIELSDSDDPDSDKKLIDEALNCLRAIASNPAGRLQIVEQRVLDTLCNIYVRDSYGVVTALQLVLYMNNYVIEIPALWQCNQDGARILVDKMSQDFSNEQELKKFELCDTLTTIIPTMAETLSSWEEKMWQSRIRETLATVLRNKLVVNHRTSALRLTSVMLQSYGATWAAPPESQDCVFFTLSVGLACVETRMLLEQAEMEKVFDSSSVLVACYSILEAGISALAECNITSIDEKKAIQLRTTLSEAFSAVIFFLKNICDSPSEKIDEEFVLASVRVLGAWLAEETESQNDDICKLLPFLLSLCKKSCDKLPGFTGGVTKTTDDIDVLRFLLPALCHLSADDQARSILISNNCHIMLSQYMVYNWNLVLTCRQTGETYKLETSVDALNTVCGVFLNFAVLESQLVSTDTVFIELLSYCIRTVPIIGSENTLLGFSANLITLGLMLLRKQPHRTIDEQFFGAVTTHLRRFHTVNSKSELAIREVYSDTWEEISELWYLSIQEFCNLSEKYPTVVDEIIDSQWFKDIIALLTKAAGGSLNEETRTAYETLLCLMYKMKPALKDTIGKDLARKHKMENLLR